jgi:Fuc2NAc and GlcNAc transferase
VALVGFVDDHASVPARWRLFSHFVGAGSALILLGGLPPLSVFGAQVDLGWLGNGLAAIYLVWLLNLYNFMDGINGIAAIEAFTVCLGGGVLYVLTPAVGSEWVPLAVLASAVIGFLFWNFPRAKVFMGDSGSGFIGIILGVFSIEAAWVTPSLFWGWLILLGVFIVDATVTLVRRVGRGDKFYEAHRSHAYQYAARRLSSHIPVSLSVGAINVFWLLPIAATVALGKLDGAFGVAIAYVPLVGLVYYLKAGAREQQEI